MSESGSNNRIARRDYYELNAELKLTPEQLRSLTIRPCPSCETRLIQDDRKYCNHCQQEFADKQAKEKATIFFLAVFFTWGMLLECFGKGHDTLFQLGGVALLIVAVAGLAWSLFLEWCQIYGRDFLASLGNAITRLFKG